MRKRKNWREGVEERVRKVERWEKEGEAEKECQLREGSIGPKKVSTPRKKSDSGKKDPGKNMLKEIQGTFEQKKQESSFLGLVCEGVKCEHDDDDDDGSLTLFLVHHEIIILQPDE